MSDFDNLYSDLSAHINILEHQFIARFLPPDPSTSPSEYEHFVKAYCILSHAAIEEYFEILSLKVMSQSLKEWLTKRRYTDTLTTLICTYGPKIKIDEDETTRETKVFDYLRPIFEDVKARFSSDIFNNHGISTKYLRKILIPVAI